MQNSKRTFLLLSIFFISHFSFATGIKFEHLSLKEGLEKAKKENKPLFIDIYATWCGPCKMLTKSTFTDEELGDYMNEHFVNIKLDGEKEDGAGLMSDFDLNAYPSMIFITPESALIELIEGFVDAETILDEATGIVSPESKEIFQLTKRFDEGERDQEFLQALIHEALIEDEDASRFVNAYMELFPQLNLKNESEFIVFGAGTNDLENKHVIDFLEHPNKYSDTHGHLAQWKISLILLSFVDEAQSANNSNDIDKKVDEIFDAYKVIMADDAMGKSDLIDMLNQMVAEE